MDQYNLGVGEKTLTCTGGSLSFVQEINDLSTEVDSLATRDGEYGHVSDINYRIDIFTTGVSESQISVIPAIVQTAGTVTSAILTTNYDIEACLASQISDDFGYQVLGNTRVSRFHTISDGAGGSILVPSLSFQLRIPKKIRNLLNKETQTEKLQQVKLVLVGQTTGAAIMQMHHSRTIRFMGRRKSITIR